MKETNGIIVILGRHYEFFKLAILFNFSNDPQFSAIRAYRSFKYGNLVLAVKSQFFFSFQKKLLVPVKRSIHPLQSANKKVISRLNQSLAIFISQRTDMNKRYGLVYGDV